MSDPTTQQAAFGRPTVSSDPAARLVTGPGSAPSEQGSSDNEAAGTGKKPSRAATTGGLYGSDLAGNLTRATVAEFVGTFILVLVGCGVAVSGSMSNGVFDGIDAAIAFGLTLAALATALGHISGCHLNPAVTLGLAATRKFPLAYAPAYLLAQVGGAVLAAFTLWGAFGSPARTDALLGTPVPSPGLPLLRAGLVEAVITFVLVLVVIAVATDDRVAPAAAGLAAGFALFAGVAVGGTLTGGSVNPARAIGPMLVSGAFPMWGMYLVAPILGGVVAAFVYDAVLSKADKPEA
jgi:MIP family channel proteins